jgi:hypothetical protein
MYPAGYPLVVRPQKIVSIIVEYSFGGDAPVLRIVFWKISMNRPDTQPRKEGDTSPDHGVRSTTKRWTIID